MGSSVINKALPSCYVHCTRTKLSKRCNETWAMLAIVSFSIITSGNSSAELVHNGCRDQAGLIVIIMSSLELQRCCVWYNYCSAMLMYCDASAYQQAEGLVRVRNSLWKRSLAFTYSKQTGNVFCLKLMYIDTVIGCIYVVNTLHWSSLQLNSVNTTYSSSDCVACYTGVHCSWTQWTPLTVALTVWHVTLGFTAAELSEHSVQ